MSRPGIITGAANGYAPPPPKAKAHNPPPPVFDMTRDDGDHTPRSRNTPAAKARAKADATAQARRAAAQAASNAARDQATEEARARAALHTAARTAVPRSPDATTAGGTNYVRSASSFRITPTSSGPASVLSSRSPRSALKTASRVSSSSQATTSPANSMVGREAAAAAAMAG